MNNKDNARDGEESTDGTAPNQEYDNSYAVKLVWLKGELSRVNSQVSEKENQFKSFNLKPPSRDHFSSERDRLHNDIKATKESFSTELQKKREVDEHIRTVNMQVQTKNEEIAKVQSTLTSKNERKIESTILRLESQLQRRQISQAEKKALCSEIEKLKVSKEKLLTFRDLRSELDELKEKQRTLRATRDDYAGKLTAIRQEEDSIKSSLTKLKLEEDLEWNHYRDALASKELVRKEMDELFTRRKDLLHQIHQLEISNQKHNREQRKKSRPLLIPKVVKSVSLKTFSQTEKKIPYEDEITACSMLSSYLVKTFPSHSWTGDMNRSSSPTRESMADFVTSDKDNHLSDIYEGIRKRPSRRGRKQKKHPSLPEVTKKCVHHPNTLAQFVLVDVAAPAVAADIATTIKQLEERKIYFIKQQKAADELASKLFTRQRSLEHVRRLSSGSQDSFVGSHDATNSGTHTQEVETETCDGVVMHDCKDSSLPSAVRERATSEVTSEVTNKNIAPSKVARGPATDTVQSVSQSPPKIGKNKVQFCIGDETHSGGKHIDGLTLNHIDDKMSQMNAVSALGRSKSLDSFRGLNSDRDLHFTCCRRAASNDRLGLPADAYKELGGVRTEL